MKVRYFGAYADEFVGNNFVGKCRSFAEELPGVSQNVFTYRTKHEEQKPLHIY